MVKNPIWKLVEKEVTEEGSQAWWRQRVSGVSGERFVQLVLQCRFERAAVVMFCNLADELGFRIPGGKPPTYDVNQIVDQAGKSISRYDEPFHEAYALAQHHRMPTRLLDWTRNPLSAAFFAAQGANPESSGQIAIWAMATRPPWKRQLVKLFTVPRSGVGYLHAQDGLFSYLVHADSTYLETGKWPRHVDEIPAGALRKITLPKTEVPALKRLLWAERVPKAHLMPTFDNIVEALHDVIDVEEMFPPKEPDPQQEDR